MLKKTIAYTDFDGNKQEEDFYFNLTKAEVIEVNVGAGKQGLDEVLKKIIAAEDHKEIIELFKMVIMACVGKRSEDGKLFIKNDEIRQSLEFSPAYSELFMEVATDADKAAAFINGVMPADLDLGDVIAGKTQPKDHQKKTPAKTAAAKK